MELDLVLKNARIIDGTGAPLFRGAVGVKDGQIEGVYRRADAGVEATEVRDVEEAIVCPGFIDTHSHADLALFEDPTLEPKIRQGVTTEVIGHDGLSMAPVAPDDADEWREQVSGLTGEVDVEWTWGSLDAYFDAVEARGTGPNIASLVGHGTARFAVMGMEDRRPTDEELGEMGDLIEEALEKGALGLSTGLIYPPSSYADTGELRALSRRAAAYGRPLVPHARSEGRWIWDALDELIDIGVETGVPLHLTHFKMAGPRQHGKADRGIAVLDVARERGLDLTVEQYPYTAASTMLAAVLPPWVHAHGPKTMRDQLGEPEVRGRIKRDIEDWRIEGWENYGALAGWENIVITSVPPDGDSTLEGESIAEIAADRDSDPVPMVCDVLREEGLGVTMLLHLMDEDDVETIMAYERVNIASDSLFGGKPHPRVFGTFPRVLGTYVRERNLLTLEEAIRKMTSLPARAMGLDSRGVLRTGMAADLAVFDPDTVASPATFDDPRRSPIGVRDVIVRGEFVVKDEELRSATPGTVIRA